MDYREILLLFYLEIEFICPYRISIIRIYMYTRFNYPDFHGNLYKLERKSNLPIKTRKIT